MSRTKSFLDAKRSTILFAVALVLRLVVAWVHPGSTDVKRWLFFAELADRGAIEELYGSENPLWNHPAPMILFLKVVSVFVSLGLPFPFALKLLPVFADVGTVTLVLKLGRRFLSPPWSFVLAASYALSPAAIAISAFHGNTDCIMVFLLLAAIVVFKNHPSRSALLLGGAIATKYVSLLLLPVFVLRRATLRKMLAFGLLALAPLALISFAFVYRFPVRAVHNIATYSSIPGAWGLWHVRDAIELGLFGSLGTSALVFAVDWVLGQSKFLIVASVLALALIGLTRRLPLLDSVAVAMSLFFALTPGFGVQYTVWLLPFLLLASPFWGTVFNLSMSHFVTNAFYEGQVNDMGMINPDVHVTMFSLVGYAGVLGYLVMFAVRFRRGEIRGEAT